MAVAGIGGGYLISSHKVRAELARIRAAGEPVTPDDLDAFYSLPLGKQDTSVLWLAAAEAVSQPEYEAEALRLPIVGKPNGDSDEPEPELPKPSEPWVYDLAVEQFLGKHAEILATVHEAAALGGEARYPTKFEDGVKMSLNSQVHLRSVARLLALQSEVSLRRGDQRGAVGSVRAIFALARGCEREPVLIAEILRVVIDGMAVDGLQRLVLNVDLSDEDLTLIEQDLTALEYHRQLHNAMLGERVLGLQSFDDPEIRGDAAPGDLVWRLFRPVDRAVYLQAMRELIAASGAPDYLSLGTAVDRAQRDIAVVLSAPSARWRCPMSKLRVPSLDSMTDVVGLGAARRELARTAIAAEKFRRMHGRLPGALDELTPDFLPQAPVDPFSGASLHWVISGNEYGVYSVGVNGIDEGAIPEKVGDHDDIFFHWRQR
ncbi:MAG TPA: hypothetical protein VFI31_08940 [Pirellulales bacterium]|nr:hypothetical protein [Pirellulales bacterium]